MKYWVTGGDEAYLKFSEILCKSLLKTSKYPVIVYGFNCDVNFNFPNVIKRRIDFDDYGQFKTDFSNINYNLKNKNWSKLFIKYKIAIELLEEFNDIENFAFLDSDMVAIDNIDSIFEHTSNITNHPLYMRYYHEDISMWRNIGDMRVEGRYGSEICSIFNVKRNPNNFIVAGGLFLFNHRCRWFFDEVLGTYDTLRSVDFYLWADDRAFSEEVVANFIHWKYGFTSHLPITWVNRLNEFKNNFSNLHLKLIENGMDLMYDVNSLTPLFYHGPDSTFVNKTGEFLNEVYESTHGNFPKNLMIVSHPDDEIIFGGDELIRFSKDYKVVCVSSGYDSVRRPEFESVMAELGISDYEIWDYEDSLFNPFSDQIMFDLRRVLGERSWDKVVTHNPIGEYGHPQHRDLYLRVSALKSDIFVFCKEPQKLDEDTLLRKRELLKLYKSQCDIIYQLEVKNGRWFISNDDSTNYIENSRISKYSHQLDTTEFIKCFDK